MSVVTNSARSFVNTMVKIYDDLHHTGVSNSQDIFTEREVGLKESSLKMYSKQLEEAKWGFDYVALDSEIVKSYKESAPTLSQLFALAGILDGPSRDSDQKKAASLDTTRSLIIEALAQDHLRNKKTYELDPIGLVRYYLMIPMAELKGKTASPPQFANGKRHFYAQIFQEVFSHCDVQNKQKIIEQLPHFKTIWNTRSARLQRVVFKVEGVLNSYFTNKYVKVGVSIVFGYASYHAAKKTMAVAGQVLAFVVVSRVPDFVIQKFNGACAYIATTRIYMIFANAGLPQSTAICHFVPVMGWFYAPFFTLAGNVQAFCYERLFGPDARTQVAISESLKKETEKQKLLDDGMKVYQVWMYLMEHGAQEGAFN